MCDREGEKRGERDDLEYGSDLYVEACCKRRSTEINGLTGKSSGPRKAAEVLFRLSDQLHLIVLYSAKSSPSGQRSI